MKHLSTSSLVVLSLLLSGPTAGQPVDPDEATEITRPAQDDDEGTEITRPAGDEDTSVSSAADDAPSGPFVGRLGGYFYDKWAFDTRHDGNREDVFDVRTKLGLSAEVTTPSMTRAFVSARFSHFVVGEDAADEEWYLFNSRNVKWEYEADLLEAYLYIPNDYVNLRVGNQIVRWGSGEFNKPSDVLNPQDFREGLFNDLEVPLIPVFMVHLDRSFGPVNLSVVWEPFFTPNRTNLFGQDWGPMSAMYGNPAFSSLGGMTGMYDMVSGLLSPKLEDRVQPLMLATDPPDERLENGQWGGRAATSFLGVDVAVSYFYGWDKLPWIHVNSEFFGDLAVIQSLATEHPAALQVLQGISKVNFSTMEGVPEMLKAYDELAEEDKEALQQAMDAVNRMLFDEEGNLKEIAISDIFNTSYRRQQTVGLSLSTILFSRVGLKADAAFSPSRTLFLENKTGFPSPASKPTISYSIGLDYNRSTWFDALIEFYHFHVLDLASDERVFVIGSDLYMLTAATHLRLFDFDQLELQLAGMLELKMLNLFLFPKVTWKATDNFRIGVGAVVAEVLPGGDEMGPAGLFDRNDAAYFDLKYSF
ncbi:MAG: DUF1302 domain-containing protein [Deltaproteobacteria bacterium]|nr:DUF1302 domain-containing protein [Deltaproteobacteria bacterium]